MCQEQSGQWNTGAGGCWSRPDQPHPALHTVQAFHGDLLQHTEKNTKLDMQFIQSESGTHPGTRPIAQQACLSHLTDGHTEPVLGTDWPQVVHVPNSQRALPLSSALAHRPRCLEPFDMRVSTPLSTPSKDTASTTRIDAATEPPAWRRACPSCGMEQEGQDARG